MATHDLDGTHTTPCLAKPNLAKTKTNNFKLEISKEMLKLLCDNAYNGADANDAIDHITIFLEIMDLVRIQSVDPEQLRIFAFQYPLIENAHKWWMPEVNHMITSWEELVNKLFYKYYLLSRAGYDNTTLFDDEESSDDDDNKLNHINHHDINPLLNPYPSVKDEGTKSHHMMCNDNNSGPKNFVQNDAPHSGNNNQGNEGLCRVDKFEVIKYSIVDNEEFMGIRTLERDSWAQSINGISNIYLDIFYKKDEGNYGVTCEDEAKRRNSGTKTKTFEENCYLLLYAVSSKEDTAYQRQLITRIRVIINSRSGVSLFTYTPYAQLVISQRYEVNVIDGN
ncbi:hypothetical protein Tco_0649656 [Tanacetum coccineum]